MKAIILDGSNANDRTGERVRSTLEVQLQAHGWQVEHILLREKKIGNCAGDFFCWVRSPGLCNVDDDNREIAEAIINSDLMIYLTPVTFGGYSSALKRIVDHQIQNISPFFARVNGETHHQRRYERYPDFLALGWQEAPDAQAEAVFRGLARRNAINYYAAHAAVGVIQAAHTDAEVSALIESRLEELQKGQSAAATIQQKPAPAAQPFHGTVRRALLLVGSPRTRKSTSHSLGGYLFDRLAEAGVETETIFIHTSLRSPERMKALLDGVQAADLVVLAFPLYVDSLPAPVIQALERIAAHRNLAGEPRSQLFAAIANCGFPEAHHNDHALAICETFARQSGFTWGGALALGAGEGLVHGAPLLEMDGRAIPLRKALDLAAASLAHGQPIPQAARDLLAKPFIPGWLYRLFGGLGWRQQAKRYGAQDQLRRKTYQPNGSTQE